MTSPSPLLRRFLIALFIIFGAAVLGGAGFLAYFWWFIHPIPLPPPADRARVLQRASEYLDAWARGDTRTMVSLGSRASRYRNGRFPKFPGGSVVVTRQFWLPSKPIARVLAGVVTKHDHDYWPRWRKDRIAFIVYTHAALKDSPAKRYFLILVRDDREWMVLNGPGCELDLHPRSNPESSEPSRRPNARQRQTEMR